jgi:hypothetical protein
MTYSDSSKPTPNESDLISFKKQLLSCVSEDNGETSDVYLHKVSLKKTAITNQILDIMKESSIDCAFNLETNRGTGGFNENLTCYTNNAPNGNETYNVDDDSIQVDEYSGYQIKILYQEFKLGNGKKLKTYISFNVPDKDKDKPIFELIKTTPKASLYDFFAVNNITQANQSTFTKREDAIKYVMDNIKSEHKIGEVNIDGGEMMPVFSKPYSKSFKTSLKYFQSGHEDSLITKDMDIVINNEYNDDTEYIGDWRQKLQALYQREINMKTFEDEQKVMRTLSKTETTNTSDVKSQGSEQDSQISDVKSQDSEQDSQRSDVKSQGSEQDSQRSDVKSQGSQELSSLDKLKLLKKKKKK